MMSIRFRSLTLVAALTLAACGTPQPEPPAPVPPTGDGPEEPAVNLHQQAQEMVEQGRILAAVRLYRQLAAETPSPRKEKIELDIVSLLLEHGYPELAQDELAPLELLPMDPELDLYRQSLRSQLALTLGQVQLALDTLPPPESASTANVGAHILLTRARILERLGQTRESLADLARVEQLTGDPAVLASLREDLWRQLQALPDELLSAIAADTRQPGLAGWADLALALRNAPLQPQGIRQAVAAWRGDNPDHPAAESFADQVVERLFAEQGYPERLTLLLPLSGPLAGYAAAVRDGFLSAYYQTDADELRPQIEVVDVGSEGRDPVAAYREAVNQGSGMIVGPLQKSNVQQIAAIGELDVPVLSLNYLDPETLPPAGLTQFGLLPEDEAAQAAETAVQRGLRRVVMLTPESNWGRRMRASFAETYERLGGMILDSAEFPVDANDFGNSIRRVLNLERSDIRHRALRSTIGGRAKFEPRRREDVDLVFIAADPRQARLLKPQLRFHRAADLPVYATSRAYAGQPSAEDDHDLEGLYFCDLPWLLVDATEASDRFQRIQGLWPEALADQPRLIALGMDAYEIVPFLRRLALQRDAVFDGRTGLLRLDDRRRVHRRLEWARFRDGVPQPLDWTPSPAPLNQLAGSELPATEAGLGPDTESGLSTSRGSAIR